MPGFERLVTSRTGLRYGDRVILSLTIGEGRPCPTNPSGTYLGS